MNAKKTGVGAAPALGFIRKKLRDWPAAIWPVFQPGAGARVSYGAGQAAAGVAPATAGGVAAVPGTVTVASRVASSNIGRS